MKKGYTLIELMVVIAIVGILLAFVVPVITTPSNNDITNQVEIVEQQRPSPSTEQLSQPAQKNIEKGENKPL